MNSEEKMKRNNPPKIELTDDELEGIAGGTTPAGYGKPCRCPTCNATLQTVPGTECPWCSVKGIKSRMVLD